MTLAREGYLIISSALVLAVLFVVAGLWLSGLGGGLLIAIGMVSLGFTVWFFRDPRRVPPDVTFSVEIRDRVAGGETIIGHIPEHRLAKASPAVDREAA